MTISIKFGFYCIILGGGGEIYSKSYLKVIAYRKYKILFSPCVMCFNRAKQY